MLMPATNTYVVKGDLDSCQWKYFNGEFVNDKEPCGVLNFGSELAKETLIGTMGEERSEYLVSFDVAAAMMANPDKTIEFARIKFVIRSAKARDNVDIKIGRIATEDPWLPGNQNAQLAVMGASWGDRSNELGNVAPWSGGDGPSSGAEPVVQITMVDLPAGGDVHVEEGFPVGVLNTVMNEELNPGFVIHTNAAPLLLKNMHTDQPPKLELTLCPKN